MAKNSTEYAKEIQAQKEADPLLAGLTNTSSKGRWYHIRDIFSQQLATFSQLFDTFYASMTAKAKEAISPNLTWYGATPLRYEHGNTLVDTTGTGVFGYLSEDEDKRVVLKSVSSFNGSAVIIKVAKSDDNDGLSPLDASELAGLNAFCAKIFPPDNFSIISASGDVMTITANISCDLGIYSSDGSLISDSAVFPVEDAINGYLTSYQNDDFSNEIRLLNIYDAIQSAQGISNVVLSACIFTDVNDVSVNIVGSAKQSIQTYSGWALFDAENSTINYFNA